MPHFKETGKTNPQTGKTNPQTGKTNPQTGKNDPHSKMLHSKSVTAGIQSKG
jgi:hypothetical protein